MKRRFVSGVITFLVLAATARPAFADPCSGDFIATEKSLFKIYMTLRKNSAKCPYTGIDFLNYGTRAYLAGRYGESLWATEHGMAQKNPESVKMQLIYTRGLAFLGRGRNEEAITTLQEIAMQKGEVSGAQLETRQRAHLALIKAYYARSGDKNDDNVLFLARLFRERYPQSRYLPVLDKWIKSPYLP